MTPPRGVYCLQHFGEVTQGFHVFSPKKISWDAPKDALSTLRKHASDGDDKWVPRPGGWAFFGHAAVPLIQGPPLCAEGPQSGYDAVGKPLSGGGLWPDQRFLP